MHDSWEPEEGLTDAPDILKRYRQDQGLDEKSSKTAKRGKRKAT